MEDLLKNQDAADPNRIATPTGQYDHVRFSAFDVAYTEDELKMGNVEAMVTDSDHYQAHRDLSSQVTMEDQAFASLEHGFSWGMIELGVEEPLPPQDVIDELDEITYYNHEEIGF